jgi:small subunit ribosomal protein S36
VLAGVRSRVPAVVWAITGLHVSLLLLYAVLYPPYLGPDEPQHVDMVVALRAGDGWQAPGQRALSLGVYRTSDPIYPQGDIEALSRPYRPEQFAPRAKRPSLEEAGGDAPSVGALPNQMVQHPPLYYATGALVLSLVPGADDLPYDRTVAVLRLVSIALVAPLPVLCWAGARLVSASAAVAATAAAFPVAVPGMTRIGAMAGNDSLIILAGAAATVALLRVARGDLSPRTAAATGGLVTLALLAKGFGLVFLPLLVLAYVLAGVGARSWAFLRPVVLAGAVATVGAAWWVRNLVLYGVLQPRGFGDEATAQVLGERRPAGDAVELLPFVDGFATAVTTRFWGGLGVVEPPTFPLWLAAVLSAAVVVLAVVGLVVSAGRRPALVLALMPLSLILGLTVASSWGAYVTYGRDPGVQGRYLYAGVLGMALLAAAGLRAALRRWAVAALLLGALGLQVYAVGLVLDDFWVGRAGLAVGLDALRGVSPWESAAAASAVAVAVGAALSLLCSLRQGGKAHPRPQVQPSASQPR